MKHDKPRKCSKHLLSVPTSSWCFPKWFDGGLFLLCINPEPLGHRTLVLLPSEATLPIKLSSFLSKTEFLCILSTDPLPVTFHAYFVFLLGINLYLVPSLFGGGLTSEGKWEFRRWLNPISHLLSQLPSPNDTDFKKKKKKWFWHHTRGAVVRLVLEVHQFCASILTIQTPWNANSTSKLLIPWNLLLAVFPWIYNALILKSPI